MDVPSRVQWYLLSGWLDNAPLGSYKSLCMSVTQSLPHDVGFILLWVCLSNLTIDSWGAGTMLIYLYISQSLAGCLEHCGHSVNFCWTKLLELTLLQKVINLLNNYHEDPCQPRRKILSWPVKSHLSRNAGYISYFAFFLRVKNTDRILLLSNYKENI